MICGFGFLRVGHPRESHRVSNRPTDIYFNSPPNRSTCHTRVVCHADLPCSSSPLFTCKLLLPLFDCCVELICFALLLCFSFCLAFFALRNGRTTLHCRRADQQQHGNKKSGGKHTNMKGKKTKQSLAGGEIDSCGPLARSSDVIEKSMHVLASACIARAICGFEFCVRCVR